MVPGHDVRFGEQAAVGIHWQLTAHFDPATLRERGSLTGLAETETLERDPGEDRERVVREKRIDVLMSDAGHLVHGLEARVVLKHGLLCDTEAGIGPDELLMTAGQALHPTDVHRRFLEIASTLGGHNDHARRAVVHEAVIEQMKRLAYVTGRDIVIDAVGLAHDRGR